ncbi:hypothetical protein GCM10007108_11590 [Thermogymnomonas acidicola]|uniref:Spermatogenesis-associated protein 20-like TRX domain-containing protein n=1 Tax=Thermogymnomonas acidicola TaxID=399579 RepID=A0AA37BRM3_9ARCH|nr:hypothetical protein GCM10007108_11590 [Thermogymnomonas acidicola]
MMHADNPVDWYPWGEEAFERARREDKPVFLSIGYSTCHWCHVMERESFSDPEVASELNRTFVCIKVDREERPDIDATYMMFCQLANGSGGWPLNVVLTPSGKPLFALTYIPRVSRRGQMGIIDFARAVRELWQERRDELEGRADEILKELRSRAPSGGGDIDPYVIQRAAEALAISYDEVNGGFGSAPKFPTPHNLMFLVLNYFRTGDANSLRMARETLRTIRWRGIFDQVGHGFHRYSTDQAWVIPHFEKMLYDQAMLMMAYSWAYWASGDNDLKETIYEVDGFLQREMKGPGYYFTAIDADSEGQEGKFYTWSSAELKSILGSEYADFASTFSVREEGNYLEEATGRNTGRNILFSLSPLQRDGRIEGWRRKLLEAREKRVRPATDDKALTDNNALLAAAYLMAFRATSDTVFRDRGLEIISAIDRYMVKGGVLMHSYRDGEASVPAFLDDYAYLSLALLMAYESTMETAFLDRLVRTVEEMNGLFWDSNGGGFFRSREGQGNLVRMKEAYDGAVPSGNSVASYVLAALYSLTGREEYADMASRALGCFRAEIERGPEYHCFALMALDLLRSRTYCAVISSTGGGWEELHRKLFNAFRPNLFVLLHSGQVDLPKTETIPVSDRPLVYLCTSTECMQPTASAEAVLHACTP